MESNEPRADIPISEQYRIVAKKWVDADSAATLREETKSAFYSQLMLEHTDKPVNRAEIAVKASDEWQDFVASMVEARKEANLLKVQLKYIEMKFYEWQSYNATKRAEMKL
jgi:hypothetical protein